MIIQLRRALTLLILAVALVGCSGEEGSDDVLRIACVLPSGHPTSEALSFFEKRVETLTEGKVDVQIFLNSQLGNATETVEGLQRGNIEMAVVSAAPLAQFVPEINALVLPYIFRSKAHQYKVLDGEVGKEIKDILAQEGLRVSAYFDAGTRNIMTKSGPIDSPSDLSGQKIRVMSSKIAVDAINALGASAVPMDQGEVYSALQTGVLDGWENNPPTALSFKMYETGCNHFAWTRHLAIPDLFLVGTEVYKELDPEVRTKLDQAASETQERQRTLWKKHSKEAVQTLKERGMQFSQVDTGLFASEVQSIYSKYYERYGDQFKQIAKKIRNVEVQDSSSEAGQSR